MNQNEKVHSAWLWMHYAYGAVIFLVGLDKVLGMNSIAAWAKYVSPAVSGMLPFSVGAFIVILGVIEVVVGALFFTRYALLASYISVAWFLLVSIDLLMSGGYVDLAIVNILLAIGAFATGQLANAEGYTNTGRMSESSGGRHAMA